MPKPPKPSPVDDAINRMTGDDDGDEAPSVPPDAPERQAPPAMASRERKPKGAPRGHPFKKGGKHKHGGHPFPKRKG